MIRGSEIEPCISDKKLCFWSKDQGSRVDTTEDQITKDKSISKLKEVKSGFWESVSDGIIILSSVIN